MELSWDHAKPYLHEVVVCSGDIDQLGHTNNGVYTRWCEQAAWQHTEHLGVGIEDYHRLQRAMAIQHASYDYLAPGFVDDRLVVGTWLSGGDRRFTLERSFQINNEATGKCLFRGSWQLVCINLSTNKPARMPEAFKLAYCSIVVD